MFLDLSQHNKHRRTRRPRKASKTNKFERYVPQEAFRRETKEYPSLTTDAVMCVKPERHLYTGTLIKGISVLHKSNAVPVTNNQDIHDIARMRR